MQVSPTTNLKPGTFAADVLAGLSAAPKFLHAKYFYDDQGSRLFEQIMQLPEYYPTRTESQILETHKHALLQMLQSNDWHLIDLGAGDAAKTRILIDYFYRNDLNFEYIPADISPYAVDDLTARLQKAYIHLPVRGVAGDYDYAFHWIRQQVAGRKFVLFLGSNIGNFTEEDTLAFLVKIRQTLQPGDRLLVGFDLKKEGRLIHQAYNDAAGVTEAFNKNLLRRINSELGGNFQVDTFDFHAAYNPASGFVRSYLTSKKRQTIRIEAFNQEFSFQPWEAIHMENSRKFDLAEIEALAAASGFAVEKNLFDPQQWFVDSIWQVGEINR